MFENNTKLQNSTLIRWESNLDKNMGNDKKIFWVFLSKVNTNCSTSLYMINKENNPQWSLLCNTIHVVNSLIYSTKQMTPNFEVSDKMKSLVERCQIKNICKWKFYHVIETFKKYYWINVDKFNLDSLTVFSCDSSKVFWTNKNTIDSIILFIDI